MYRLNAVGLNILWDLLKVDVTRTTRESKIKKSLNILFHPQTD